MFRGKNYKASVASFDKSANYEPAEAMKIVVDTAKAKFDETIELHVKLGVDSRHADQQVRGVCVLPNGTGKTVKVLVIAKGEKADQAQAAGADFVGAEDMIAKIQNEGWFGFDVMIKVEYRVDKTSIVHVPIGKKSFGPEKLLENFNTVMEALVKAKPAASKGTYLRSISISATMGPGVKVIYRMN